MIVASTPYGGWEPLRGPAPSKPQGSGGVDGPQGTSGASGNKAADIAKQFLGRNASELKRSGDLPMNPNVPSNICCANFVSAVLQKAGVLDKHTDLVSGSSKTGRGVEGSIGQILKDRGWKVVDAAHAKPGDVAIVNDGGHVELVASNKNGDITLIGSNNINKDGTQQVSYGKPYGGAWYLTRRKRSCVRNAKRAALGPPFCCRCFFVAAASSAPRTGGARCDAGRDYGTSKIASGAPYCAAHGAQAMSVGPTTLVTSFHCVVWPRRSAAWTFDFMPASAASANGVSAYSIGWPPGVWIDA